MIGSPEECTKAFEVVLSKLIETKWRSSTAADDLLEQYKCFLHIVKKEYEFEFKNCKERVDAFLYAHINDRKELEPLWRCVQTVDDIISQPVYSGKRIQCQC